MDRVQSTIVELIMLRHNIQSANLGLIDLHSRKPLPKEKFMELSGILAVAAMRTEELIDEVSFV